MKVLLSGAAGFLGSQILKMLLADDDHVSCLIHRSDIAYSDVTKLHSINDLDDDYEVVYHTSAYIPYGHLRTKSPLLKEVNVDLTRALLKKLPSARFVFTSTTSVYGDLNEKIAIDSDFHNPSEYAISKIEAEKLVRAQASFAILRLTSLIGEGMKAISFVPQIIEQAKSSSFVNLYGDGSRLQNYLDVRDAAWLTVKAGHMERNFTALGVSDKSHSNLQVSEIVSSLTGAKIRASGEDFSVSRVYDYHSSHEMMNFKPKYSIEETIKSMVQ